MQLYCFFSKIQSHIYIATYIPRWFGQHEQTASTIHQYTTLKYIESFIKQSNTLIYTIIQQNNTVCAEIEVFWSTVSSGDYIFMWKVSGLYCKVHEMANFCTTPLHYCHVSQSNQL